MKTAITENQKGYSERDRWYARGVRLAKLWIEANGSLDRDGPNTPHDPFYNGFIDTINEERAKTVDKGKPHGSTRTNQQMAR
jgi:hypothetical protein